MKQRSWVLCLVLWVVVGVAESQEPKPAPVSGVRLDQLLGKTWHIVAYTKFILLPKTCHDATVNYRRQGEQLRAEFMYCEKRNPNNKECEGLLLKEYPIRRTSNSGEASDWQSGAWNTGNMEMNPFLLKWVDHWVVYIDPHRQPGAVPSYFVIGGEAGDRVFIYKADDKPMPWATYQEILQALRARGFQPGTMILCKQSLETPSK